MLEMKRLIFTLMALALFALPKPAMGQVFPAERHTLQNGIYEIYYSTSSLSAANTYHIYVKAKLPDAQPFFLTSVAGDMENIRGKEEDKLILWSPMLEGKTPDDYSFELYAIDSRILDARLEGQKFDIKDGFGWVKLESNVKDAVFKLNKVELHPEKELLFPTGTYRFIAEAKGFPQITQNHTVIRDQSSRVVFSFPIAYLTVLVNRRDKDIHKVVVKPENQAYASFFEQEIKPGEKNTLLPNKYIVSAELYDGSKKSMFVSLEVGESKTLRIDFAKIDLPDYEWIKKFKGGFLARLATEIQLGVFHNEYFNGLTLSVPLWYFERRVPVGDGTYFAGSFALSEHLGLMFANSKDGDLSGFFWDLLPIGAGLGYASPNLYNLTAMLKGGICFPPIHREYEDEVLGNFFLDIDFALNKYLRNKKNFRANLRYRLFDDIEDVYRPGWSIQKGTFLIDFGFNFYEIPFN